MPTIAENLQRLVDAKDDIAAAIAAKGGTVAQGDGLEEFPTAINGISTGVDTSNDTVTANTLAKDVTAHDASGAQITGTLDLTYKILNKPATIDSSDYLIPNRPIWRNIIIPSSVKTLGNSAFKKCTNLISITIPSSVTSSIYNSIFSDCISLKNIIIPDSITSIGDNAFGYCTSLETITIHQPQDSISGAPWGATNATVVWTG